LQNVQNSLKDKDELLEQIINNLSGYAVYMLDKKGNIKSWNAGAQSLLGFTTEEVIGKHFSIFYPPEQTNHKPQQALQTATDTGKFEEESLRLKKDGGLFWASVVLTSIRGKRGALKGFVKIIRDITSQKDLEISLRFRDQILADMAEGVSIIRLSDSKIIYANSAFATMFGYERNELIGQNVAILNENGKLWFDPLRKSITQTLKTQHTWTGEVGNRKKDGTVFISQVTVSPISYYTVGNCWINVHQDITTKKELEWQKDAFIGLASHELKTPLTALSAYAQLLEKRLGKDLTNQQYVKNITHQTNRLLSLVDDLLNVSRIDSGKLDLHLKPLNLNALTTKIVDDFNQTTTSHRFLLQSSLDQKVLADKNRIEQVIINVLTNAVKYSPHADKVAVKLSADQTSAIVAIQDFGAGISQNDQQHLFERFYRTRDKQDGNISGFGLGLYIARQIVTEHGGQMWVKSQKGKGSTFYFTLPLYKS
jgi:PAS domain S-box-containing protein